MAIILNIETSTKNCSVSLSKDGISFILAEKKSDKYSHDKNLHCFIDYIIKKSCTKFSDLNAICISKGPGSYTGLRIGSSSAKGLCFALNIPLLAIDTLNVMTQGFNFNSINDEILIPMINSRHNEVYTAVFNKYKKKIIPTQVKILNKNSFQDYYKNKVYIFGDGSCKAKKLLNIPAFYFPNFYPSAFHMSFFSNKLFKEKKFENLDNFEPFYLKNFINSFTKN